MKHISENEQFYRDVTQAVSSSLDVNVTLRRLLEQLEKRIPVNQIMLNYSADMRCHCIAQIENLEKFSDNSWLVTTPEATKWGQQQRRPIIFSHLKVKSFLPEAFLEELKRNDMLTVPLRIEDELVGFLTLRSEGPDRYNSGHADLMDMIAKPCALALANAKNHASLQRSRDILADDNRFLTKEVLSRPSAMIIGENSGLRNVMELVRQVAELQSTVLLSGETGTGKEVIANAIHLASRRKDGPYIKLNCGAIPENLIDDELFGHEKGAFTGAISQKRGRFERADGGTLFLDEIGELPLQSQVRLLRVLQSRFITRVGGERPIPVDVRIIAATNRNLKHMVNQKEFREDLWFRLNVFNIDLPPLRERKDDIPSLIRYFVEQKSIQMNKALIPDIAPETYERLRNYSWPGNVRELENLVERELIRHYPGKQLKFDGLALEVDVVTSKSYFASGSGIDDSLSLDNAVSNHIIRVLKMTRGKIYGPGGAAQLLCMNPSTLKWRILKLGISMHGLKAGNVENHGTGQLPTDLNEIEHLYQRN